MRRKHIAFLLVLCLLAGTIPVSSVYADGFPEYAIKYNGNKTSETGFYVKGNVYLPVSMLGNELKSSVMWADTANMRLNIDLSRANIMMADRETSDFIKANAGIVYIPLKEINGRICFSVNAAGQFLHTGFSISGNTIKLKTYDRFERAARIGSHPVRAASSLFGGNSNDTIDFAPGDRIFIEGETENYYKFSDFDGNLCYALKSDIVIENIDLSTVDFYAPRKIKFRPPAGHRINVAWQYVNSVTPTAPGPTAGIDVMAPTWFRLAVSGGGDIINSGDRGYTDLCHKNGMKVWATITNNMSEKGASSFTSSLLSSASMKDRAIAQYIFYACLYDTDGINIDFENLRDSDAQGLVNFTREMRYYTERQGLNLSVDVMIPKPWTVEYDRDALAKYADYIAVMSYDEHYAGSRIPGSISSLPFVREAITGCLKEGVPKSKLLMGVPLYTRIWVVNSKGSIISRNAVTMDRMQSIISSNSLVPKYLSKEMQNYVEYPVSGGTAKVWIEDAVSIKNRLSLVDQYGIAGSACWQYAQGSDDIWPLFDKYLH